MDSPLVHPSGGERAEPAPYSATRFVRSAFRLVEWELAALRELMLVPARILILLDSAEAIVRRIDRISRDVERMVATVDEVLGEVTVTIEGAQRTIGRVDAIVGDVEGTIGRAEQITTDIQDTVTRAAATVSDLDGTVTRVVPLVDFASSTVASVRPVVEELLIDNELDPGKARRVADRFTELVVVTDQFAERLRPFALDVSESLTKENADALAELIDRIPGLTEAVQTEIIPVVSDMDSVAPEVSEILEVVKNCLEALQGIPGFAYLRRRGEDRK